MSLTESIPFPNEYIKAIDGEYSDYAYNEVRAVGLRGQWRELAFGVEKDAPMDLEIGTGTGYFFAHRAGSRPDRSLLGIELKYKPLIQSIRRALRGGSQNARIARYNARYPQDIFVEGELDNVFIHFPDPWLRRRQSKNRLIQPNFLNNLYLLQRPGSLVEFKTDSRDYFDAAFEYIKGSKYQVVAQTYDLHQSEFSHRNFTTQFEQIFIAQKTPINYVLFRKSDEGHGL